MLMCLTDSSAACGLTYRVLDKDISTNVQTPTSRPSMDIRLQSTSAISDTEEAIFATSLSEPDELQAFRRVHFCALLPSTGRSLGHQHEFVETEVSMRANASVIDDAKTDHQVDEEAIDEANTGKPWNYIDEALEQYVAELPAQHDRGRKLKEDSNWYFTKGPQAGEYRQVAITDETLKPFRERGNGYYVSDRVLARQYDGDQSNHERARSVNAFESLRHRCDFPGCTVARPSVKDLKKHRRCHVPMESRPHACPVQGCILRFNTPRDVQKHQITHE